MRCVAVGIFVCALVALAGCRDRKHPPIAATPGIADSADQILVTTHYLLSEGGIKRGDLTADTAYVLGQMSRFDLRHAHVIFTTETGRPQGTMEADRGLYNTQNQTLEGWGHVIVKAADGRTLETPHATYMQHTHTIASDSSYTIVRGTDRQTGIGFSYNQATGSFKCLSHCGGNFSVMLPAK